MKKILVTILGLFMFVGMGYSQNSDNATIKALANLVGEISVTNEQDLNFGDINFADPTTVSTMDTEQRGRFFIEMGPGNPNVNLVFTLPEELEHSGDGPGLEIGDWTYRVHTSNVAIVDEVLPDAPIAINMAGGMPRERYVFVGATVTPNEENWVGAYEGDLTLTVEYN